MARSRLRLALADGGLVLPDAGDIAVLGSATDLEAIPRERSVVLETFRPDHDRLGAAGYRTVTELTSAAAAVVTLDRAKAATLARVAAAITLLPDGAPVIVDGQKTDGIDAVLKLCRGCFDVQSVVSLGHGKLFWFPAARLPEDWPEAPAKNADGFHVAPGVFSSDGIDPASAALANALPSGLAGRIADLGAGWGYLSHVLLQRCANATEVHLYEADLRAMDAARQNVTDPRARFHWADVVGLSAETRFDAVITNPPFHKGRAGAPELGRAFIETAARVLSPKGSLWLVANRHLPYESALGENFAHVEPLEAPAAFKIYKAMRPRRR